MTEKELDILYDHYKDTFSYLRKYIINRDKIFVVSVILLMFLFFQIQNIDEAYNITISIITSKIGRDIFIDLNIINSIMLVVLLWIIIKYIQINLLIEKQYSYLHKIEDTLKKKISLFEISREGKLYLSNYPRVLNVIHYVYTIGFPMLIILWIILKFISEYNYFNKLWNGFLIFDSILLLVIMLITILYLSWIHFNDFKNLSE